MNRLFCKHAVTVAALAAINFALAGGASAINVLTIGDSVTYGTNSSGSEALGYQPKLKELLGPSYSFVGEYGSFEDFTSVPWSGANPSTDYPTWPSGRTYKHFGLPGASISGVHDSLNDVATPAASTPGPYVLSGDSLGDRLSAAADEPDVVIVHLGLNDLSRENVQYGSGAHASVASIDDLMDDYEALLVDVGTQFSSADIFVNLIMPKFDFNKGSGNNATAWSNSAQFNIALKDLVENVDTNGNLSSLDGRISYIDLFALEVADLTAPGIDMPASLVDLAQNDADPYVDWGGTGNAGEIYDESAATTTETVGRNTDLYSDFVHPTAAGYDVMAYGIYASLIPEPGSLVLVGLSVGGLLLRRRAQAA